MLNLPIILILYITTVINFILSIVILSRGFKVLVNVLFGLLTLTVGLWAFSIIGFYSIDPFFSTADFWINMSHSSALFLALIFFYFSLSFPFNLIKKRGVLIVPLIPFLLVIFYLFNTNSIIGSVSGIKYEINFGYIFYGILVGLYFFIGYFFLFSQYRKAKNAIQKKQVLYVFVGSVIASFLATITDLTLPILGNFNYTWLGPIFSLLLIISISIAILRHHLFNIKVIATELLTFAVWIAILIRVFLSETWSARFIELGFLAFVVVFGILIIKSVMKEVEMREKVQRLAFELKDANDRLKEMDQIKSDFVTIASHQLRTPLTAIKGYASLMLEGSYGKVPKKMEDPLNKLFRSSERMVVMVGDFLNVSRIERGKIEYEFSKFDLKKLVKELFEEFKLKMKEEKKTDPKLYFDTDVNGEVMINADEGKIKQVLSNLIDNSIKYTPALPTGGHSGFVKISFSLLSNKKAAFISVKDSGVGMDEDTLEKIFGKFNRAQDASKFNTEGSGLGLYVAKEFIKKHNGRLWAESPGEGKGSTFFVELPLGK